MSLCSRVCLLFRAAWLVSLGTLCWLNAWTAPAQAIPPPQYAPAPPDPSGYQLPAFSCQGIGCEAIPEYQIRQHYQQRVYTFQQRQQGRYVAHSVVRYAPPPHAPNIPYGGLYAAQLQHHRNRMLYHRGQFLYKQRMLRHDEPQSPPPYHIYQQNLWMLSNHRQRMQYHYQMIQHYLRLRMQHAYQQQHHHYRRYHHRRYHRPYHRPPIYRKEPRFSFRFDLGTAGTWYDPQHQHLAMDISALTVSFAGRTPNGNTFGSGFKLLQMDNEGWKTHWTRPYDWLEKNEWGHFYFFGKNKFFGMQAGFVTYRDVRWSLNDLNEALVAQNLPKTTLTPEALQILLPSLKIGFQFPDDAVAPVGFSLSVGGQMLQWDFQSFRAYAEAQLSFARVLRFVARGQYQQEQSLLQPEKKKNSCGCVSSALWEGRFWEGQLKGQIDLFSLFGRKEGRASFWSTRNDAIWGPIFLDFGVRIRQVDQHRIINPQEKLLFQEGAGLRWGFFVGLRVGADNTPLFMQ